ncbi:hypothetical protein NP493_605g01014 [Ridgeia piscesae]|uniref:Uncharacterized protein n=1 Tax=Ridgeia piscesae TaxID=27915 RepID=A0AAD9NS07_RIDPI|nr:hypothetical protein NP493_605g01014 [Ridgeia piscesae]
MASRSICRHSPDDNSCVSGEGSEYVYKKWLKSDHAREALTERSSDDWSFVMPEKEGGKTETKTQRIKFLKERDIHFRGEFTDQMKVRFDKDDVTMVKLPPQPGVAAVGTADSRSLGGQLISRAVGSHTARETTPSRDNLLKPRRTRSEMTHTYNDVTLWEPLTLSALMEYKKMRQVFGTGDFARGRVPLWPVKKD